MARQRSAFLHRPQQIAMMCRGDGEQVLRRKAERIEATAIKRTAFGERHVLGDPAHAGVPLRRQPERKTGRRREMGFARCGDLMQRAAHETAAQRRIDAFDTERKRTRFTAEAGGFLYSAQALAQLLQHRLNLWRHE